MTDDDHQDNIHDFDSWLPEVTGIDVNKLGCVMMPVEFRPGYLQRGYELGMISEEDVYTAANPDHFWIKGDVTAQAHITILYGLLTPAYDQADTIERLLADWVKPKWLRIEEFDVFPSPMEDEDYACIVAKIDKHHTGLKHARGLLSYLPHVDTFIDYLPHATVAYVQTAAAARWIDWLSQGPMAMTVPDTTDGQRFDLGSSH